MKPAVSLLVVALIVSCMALVLVRYESRVAYAELHQLDTERDDLNVEYGRLLLERATWSVHDHVARAASERLSMQKPERDSIVTLVILEKARP